MILVESIWRISGYDVKHAHLIVPPAKRKAADNSNRPGQNEALQKGEQQQN
jgi:hypothetical protein